MGKSLELTLLNEQQLLTRLSSGVDLNKRLIYLMGEVDNEMAYRFVITFHKLDQSKGDITIFLSSQGGDEQSGWTMYDTLMESQNKVQILGYGAVQSIAALLFQAGDDRQLSPECRYMIHNGTVQMSDPIDTAKFTTLGKEVAANNERYFRALAEASGKTIEQVRKMCQTETYLSAEEAVKEGFADSVISRKKKAKK